MCMVRCMHKEMTNHTTQLCTMKCPYLPNLFGSMDACVRKTAMEETAMEILIIFQTYYGLICMRFAEYVVLE